MSDDTPAASAGASFAATFAVRAGLEPPTAAEIDEVLALAADAAHASERLAAPLVTWLAGRAGMSPGEARELVRRLRPPA